MKRLELSLLGTMQAKLNGSPVTAFGTDKTRALLAYVFVEGSQPRRRETLTGLLWPDQPEESARTSLRQALYKLRQILGSQDEEGETGFLLVSPQTIQLDPGASYTLDVVEFTDLVAACRTHRHRKPEHCASCHARLLKAAELYRGDFLEGFFLEDSQPFDEWLVLKREGLRRNVLEVFARLARHYEARSEHEQALHYAFRQLDLEPWREDVHRQVMGFLAATGQRTAALAQYEACRRTLNEEFGVEPDAETMRLYERLQAGENLGARSSENRLATRHNLPRTLTPLVGRGAELARVVDQLDSPHGCLITLMGPGGVGKTRLALQAVSLQLGAFEDGVYWVPLASLSSPQLLASSIAQAVGLHFEAPENPQAQLLNYLSDKEMLLLLDSFEHLLVGVEATELLLSVLKNAPRVSILVTSRERLGIQPEYLLDLSGLPFPGMDDGRQTTDNATPFALSSDSPGDLSELLAYDAVQLFVEQAQRSDPGFVLSQDTAQGVVEICQLVAGLPLGIVLAAAGVRHFSPARIASSIRANLDFLTSSSRDASLQHTSLRAVFNYSWDLLSEEEKRVLRRVSVFRGGWDEEAAEKSVGASVQSLLSLMDKSLLRGNASGRFDIHEVLRQYAAEKLDDLPEERNEVRRSYAEYYLGLAELAETRITGDEQTKWLGRLEAEHDNLRATLSWAEENDESEIGLRLGGALWRFWYVRGHYKEGSENLAAVLGELENGTVANLQPLQLAELMRVRAKALNGAGVLATVQGDSKAARTLYEESLAVSKAQGDKQGMAASLNNLGILAHQEGDSDAGRSLQEASLMLRRELGDTMGVAASLNNLGLVAQERGDYAAARDLHEESLAARREFGDTAGIAASLNNLGLVAQELGNYPEARRLYQESLALRRELGDKGGMAELFSHLGVVEQKRGDYDAAHDLFDQGLALSRELGYKWSIALLLGNLGFVAQQRGDYAGARDLYKESLVLRKELGERIGIAVSLACLGGVIIERANMELKHRANVAQEEPGQPEWADPERAARLFGAVDKLLEGTPAVLPIEDRQLYEQNLEGVRSLLSEEQFARAWDEGRAMSMEQVITDAMKG